jgi:hypothetical protein
LPTLARASLFNSLLSIEAQTDKKNVHIIVINDSDTELKLESSMPIHILEGAKVGLAGPTRNIGMKYARNILKTDWILMLDDDDMLHPQTIEILKSYSDLNLNLDCVIFRAAGYTDHLPFMYAVPPPNTTTLQCGLVAISFALHKSTNIEYDTENKGGEDYRLLKNLETSKCKLCISKYICYGVRIALPFQKINVEDTDTFIN